MMDFVSGFRPAMAAGFALAVFSLTCVHAETNVHSIGPIAAKGKIVYKQSGVVLGTDTADALFFEEVQAPEDVRGIAGQLVFSDGRRVNLSYYENEGGQPAITDVFTYGSQAGDSLRLLVICTWSQVHAGLDTRGIYYKTYVYRPAGKRLTHLALDTASMNLLSEGFDGVQEGERVQFEVKDRASVLTILSGKKAKIPKSAPEAVR